MIFPPNYTEFGAQMKYLKTRNYLQEVCLLSTSRIVILIMINYTTSIYIDFTSILYSSKTEIRSL